MWYWRSDSLRFTFHISRFTIACVLLAGCTLVTPTEEESFKQATAEELTALLRQREAALLRGPGGGGGRARRPAVRSPPAGWRW